MWLARMLERLRDGELFVAGVSSGTSADGIDVAIARITADFLHSGPSAPSSAGSPGTPTGRVTSGIIGEVECLAFAVEPYEDNLRRRVRAVLDGRGDPAPGAEMLRGPDGPTWGPRELTLLSRDLGVAFGGAVSKLAREAGVELDLIGSHGQTVWHHDGDRAAGPASLQLGDGDFVAEAVAGDLPGVVPGDVRDPSGPAVVSDFRQRDLAAGGEGAPISGLADPWLFARLPRPAAILNLGGMANVSFLADEPTAFDVGPAGSLLDGLARRLLGKAFDAGGRVAATGRVLDPWVREVLEHPFFAVAPPKSTGRDTFGEAWVDRVLARAQGMARGGPLPDATGAAGATGADILRSAVEVVARAVAGALGRYSDWGLPRPTELVLAGGGVHNETLVAALGESAGLPVTPSAAYGVDPDAREALAFAVLAAMAISGSPTTDPAATGAARGRTLGKISPPPVPFRAGTYRIPGCGASADR